MRSLPISSENAFANQQVQMYNQHKIIGGTGVSTRQTANGTLIDITPTQYPSGMQQQGIWTTGSYRVDDVVTNQASGSSPVTGSAGTFVCVQEVPGPNSDDTCWANVVQPMIAAGTINPSMELINTFRWSFLNYLPTSPAPTLTGISQSVPGTSYFLQQGTVFWQPIGSSDPWPPVELDPTKAHSTGDYVYISPANTLVTSGMIDLDSDIQTFTDPGIWRAVKAVPAMSESMYHVPQLPLPGANGTVPGGSPMKRLILRVTHSLWNQRISTLLCRACERGHINSKQLHILAAMFDPTQKHEVY